MAYCQIVENPDASAEQFEQVVAHVRANGQFPPHGQRLLISGPAEAGWRVISVWDSQEAAEQFNSGRLVAALRETGVSAHRMTSTAFEVHTLLAGDLTGALQPA